MNKNHEALTTGIVAEVGSVGARTASRWIDGCLTDLRKIKSVDGLLEQLEHDYTQNPSAFRKKSETNGILIGEERIHLSPITFTVLGGAAPPYILPDSKDRRVPFNTALKFYQEAGIKEAVAKLTCRLNQTPAKSITKKGTHSNALNKCVIIAAQDDVHRTLEGIPRVLGSEYNIISTSTAVDALALAEKKKQNEGCYPIIVLHQSLGMDEIRDLAKWMQGKAAVLVIAKKEQIATLQYAKGITQCFDVDFAPAGEVPSYITRINSREAERPARRAM